MIKTPKIVRTGSDFLKQFSGVDCDVFDLRGYFLSAENREAVYIPKSLFVVEVFGDQFGVPVEERTGDYFDCARPSANMDRDQFRYGKMDVEGVLYEIEHGLIFPKAVGMIFRNIKSEFPYTPLAVKILCEARKDIQNS